MLPQRLRSTYDRYPPQYWLMTAGVAISSAGGGMILPFLLIYATQKLALPLIVVAPLLSLNAGTGLLSAFFAGTVADKVGRKSVMIFSLTLNGLAFLILMNASTYQQFAVMMVIIGFSNPLYQVGADAMLADLIPPENRTSAYAVSRIALNAGFALGPALGGFLIATSYNLAFYAAGASFLAYGLLLALFAHETLGTAQTDASQPKARGIPAGADQGYRRVFRDTPFVVFVLLMGLGLIAPMILWTLMPVYAKVNFGLSERLYGWIPTTNAIMCVFVQYTVSQLTRRHRALRVTALGMLVYALGTGSVALMTRFEGFWLSMVILTFGELIVVPTASKYVADLAPAVSRGRYMGSYWLAWGLARGLAPLVGATLNDRISPQAIWLGGLAIGLTSALGLLLLSRRPVTLTALQAQ